MNALKLWCVCLLLVIGAAQAQSIGEPTRMFADPLLPSPAQKQAMQQNAQRAAEEFFQQASTESAGRNYPIWLKAQSRKRIDRALAVLDKTGFPDTQVKQCREHQQEIEQSVRQAPFSLALLLTALQCAEFGASALKADQVEKLLQARVAQMMAEQRGWFPAWPIRALHRTDVWAWLEMQGVAWKSVGMTACVYVDCLIQSVDVLNTTAGTRRRFHFDISTDYLGGVIGDRSTTLERLNDVLEYFEALQRQSGYSDARYFTFLARLEPESDRSELVSLIREQLKEPDYRINASIALVGLAAEDRTVELQPEDLAPIETAAAEKDYDAMVALAIVHGLALTTDADLKLAQSLLSAANRINPRDSAAATVVSTGLVSKRETKQLFPFVEQEAKESRLLALFLRRSFKQTVATEWEVLPGGAALPEALTTFLDSAYYARWRFNDFAKQRVCRFAEAGMVPARQLCINLLKQFPLLIESQQAQAIRHAKLAQVVEMLRESNAQKMSGHCMRAAQQNLRYNDPDRALMWRYSCRAFGAKQAVVDSLMLYLRGANVSQAQRKAMHDTVEQMKDSRENDALLAAYFQAPSRELGQQSLQAACSANQQEACKLLVLQRLPWDYSPGKALSYTSILPGGITNEAAQTLLQKLEASAVAARGRGITVHIRAGTREKNRHFGTDQMQFEPFMLKKIRNGGRRMADQARRCDKVRRAWHCQADEIEARLLPAIASAIKVLHGELNDIACKQARCQQLTLHYVSAKSTIAPFDFVAHYLAIQSMTITFDAERLLPLSAEVPTDFGSFFYQYQYDRSFRPARLPTRCTEAKPSILKAPSGEVIEVVPDEDALACRF